MWEMFQVQSALYWIPADQLIQEVQTNASRSWVDNVEKSLKALPIYSRPHGKESTEVRKSQNKGKESENSYQKFK